MTRRHRTKRSVVALLGGLTLLSTTLIVSSPVSMTEAMWNDTVHVHTELTASEHAGVNYAQAVSSNGTLDRPSESEPDIPGLQLNVNNIDGEPRDSPGPEDYSTAGFLNAIDFESESQSCARVGPFYCTSPFTDSAASGTAYSSALFNSMNIAGLDVLGINVGQLAHYNANDPIVARTSCTPGQDGTADVDFGGNIVINTGPLRPNRPVPIPELGDSETIENRHM